MVLPAYLFTSGLGSKLSRWLVPPTIKSQITRLAFGVNIGFPSGGVQSPPASASPGLARATPSRWSIAPSTSPVNPMPRSARNVRRGKRWQLQSVGPWLMSAPAILGADFTQSTQRHGAHRDENRETQSCLCFGPRVLCVSVCSVLAFLANGHEVVVIQEHVDEALAGSLRRVRRRGNRSSVS